MTKRSEEALKARYDELLAFAKMIFGALVAINPNWKAHEGELKKFEDTDEKEEAE